MNATRGQGRAATLMAVRIWHSYAGAFFAPAIIFFSVTGALQTFNLHKPGPGAGFPAQEPGFAGKAGRRAKPQTGQAQEGGQTRCPPSAVQPGRPVDAQGVCSPGVVGADRHDHAWTLYVVADKPPPEGHLVVRGRLGPADSVSARGLSKRASNQGRTARTGAHRRPCRSGICTRERLSLGFQNARSCREPADQPTSFFFWCHSPDWPLPLGLPQAAKKAAGGKADGRQSPPVL